MAECSGVQAMLQAYKPDRKSPKGWLKATIPPPLSVQSPSGSAAVSAKKAGATDSAHHFEIRQNKRYAILYPRNMTGWRDPEDRSNRPDMTVYKTSQNIYHGTVPKMPSLRDRRAGKEHLEYAQTHTLRLDNKCERMRPKEMYKSITHLVHVKHGKTVEEANPGIAAQKAIITHRRLRV